MVGRRIGGWLRGRVGVLGQRQFRLLWTGETVSGVGNSMAVVGMPLLAVVTLHASTFAVAALNACGYLPWLAVGLPAGAWVDRLPRRALMITCDLVSAILYASLPIAAWAGALTMTQAVTVAFTAGIANVLFTTAYQVYLPALVGPADLIEANSKIQGSASVAAVAGRSLAGLAAQQFGAATALLGNSLSFLASAVCLAQIQADAPARRADSRGSIWRDTAEGIRFIAADPYLRPLTIYASVANLAWSGAAALTVVFLVRVAGLPPSVVGLLAGTAAAGGLAGALTARRLITRMGDARALIVSTLVTSAAGLLIPLTGPGPRTAYYVTGSLMVTAGLVIGNVIMGTFRQVYCPPAILGRAITSMRFLVYGAIPLGSLTAGALATALGTRTALWITVTGYALSTTLLLTPKLALTRNLPDTPPPATGTGRRRLRDPRGQTQEHEAGT